MDEQNTGKKNAATISEIGKINTFLDEYFDDSELAYAIVICGVDKESGGLSVAQRSTASGAMFPRELLARIAYAAIMDAGIVATEADKKAVARAIGLKLSDDAQNVGDDDE